MLNATANSLKGGLMLFLVGLSTLTYAEVQFEPAFRQLSFTAPVQLTHAGDGSNRLFVVEQGGQIRVFMNEPTVSRSAVFLDIRQSVLTGGEQGLLGLAFDPKFKLNGYIYVNYTANKPRRTVISRFQVDPNQPDRVLPGSETVLLEIEQDFANHNGGMLAFGPDGYLYIGMGDGGSGGDPNHRAQDGQSLLGKMLRIATDGSVPSDNPFVDVPDMRAEIWALGLRNPWRFSFDRATGTLWLGDVGQNKVEEVNRIVKGGNYGWRWFEGTQPYNPDDKTAATAVIAPVFEYNRKEGQSITGGYVYRGNKFPAMQGQYFFADFVSGKAWSLPVGGGNAMRLPSVPNPSSFGEDEQGELYVVSYSGALFQVVDR